MEEYKITIAVDGKSSCGKSTLAKALAQKLGYLFIDSGAMYRGIALFSLNNDCIENTKVKEEKLISSLDKINLSFSIKNGTPELILNGENVAEEIRLPAVSNIVSKIASIKEVREKLVAEQRSIGKNGGIVMDGRDIGSVVFPDAELKLFITAQNEIRVERRYKELQSKGVVVSKEDVRKNLDERDYLDSTRAESPLIQTEDAIVIDNSDLTKDEQLELAMGYATQLIERKTKLN